MAQGGSGSRGIRGHGELSGGHKDPEEVCIYDSARNVRIDGHVVSRDSTGIIIRETDEDGVVLLQPSIFIDWQDAVVIS